MCWCFDGRPSECTCSLHKQGGGKHDDCAGCAGFTGLGGWRVGETGSECLVAQARRMVDVVYMYS